MKVCYLDESGFNSEQSCLVMVGIVVDAIKLNRTGREFQQMAKKVRYCCNAEPAELKGMDIYRGRKEWHDVNPAKRQEVLRSICEWFAGRKHRIALAAIRQDRLRESVPPADGEECRDAWMAAAIHIALQIQRNSQKKRKNKGHAFLIFDVQEEKARRLSELLWRVPQWTDDYYGHSSGNKTDRLDQIINTAVFMDSKHAGLIQLADIFAYIIHTYVEIVETRLSERWEGERQFFLELVTVLRGCFLPDSDLWPQRIASGAAKWYAAMAPSALKDLGHRAKEA